jgi:translation initiation factor IF-2
MLTYAKKQGVTVSTYNVIYNLIDDVKAAMEGKLRTVEEKIEVGVRWCWWCAGAGGAGAGGAGAGGYSCC